MIFYKNFSLQKLIESWNFKFYIFEKHRVFYSRVLSSIIFSFFLYQRLTAILAQDI